MLVVQRSEDQSSPGEAVVGAEKIVVEGDGIHWTSVQEEAATSRECTTACRTVPSILDWTQ